MADALDVQCPDCGAPPKTECYTSSASVASDTHINRTDLANIEYGTCALCSRRLARLNGRRWHIGGDLGCPPLPDPHVDWNAYAAKVNEGMALGDPGDVNFRPLAASPVLCPECSNGKHPNCDGTALYPDDSLGPCQCASDTHNPPPSHEEAIDEERCSYCQEVFPSPVSLHHDEEECQINLDLLARAKAADLDARIDALHGPGAAAALDAAIADGSIFGED